MISTRADHFHRRRAQSYILSFNRQSDASAAARYDSAPSIRPHAACPGLAIRFHRKPITAFVLRLNLVSPLA
jgi:hypothetical protein